MFFASQLRMNPFSATDNDEIWMRVGQAQAWPMPGLPADLLIWATPGRRTPASRTTPARPGCKYLDRYFFFFYQALPMRRAGVAHPWLTCGPPVDHPWTTRGPPLAQPDLVEISRLGREEFCATWMPDPPDRPENFPSFA